MELRVLTVAEHASAQFGGEAALPLHYYRVLRQRGVPTWLIVHERTRTELQTLFPDDHRISYVADTIWHRTLWQISQRLPHRLGYFTTGFIMRLLTQSMQCRKVRQIVKQEGITLVHQPIPVSPKEPSMIFGLGVPVVIGPLNGGIDYPPAFRQLQNPMVNLMLPVGRKFSSVMNWLIPGKRQAALLLVANERTHQALPAGVCRQVIHLAENGVDLSLWQPQSPALTQQSPITRYVFIGRLVDWKAVDLLLLAFKQATAQTAIQLTIIGEGEEKHRLEQQAQELNLLAQHADQPGKVWFAGWMSQPECAKQLQQSSALVLPSLMECGGAVVLEAMAMGLPVIATNWGGPAEYLDPACGILVDPTSRESFICDLAAAMVHLDQSPQERQAMGRFGREKVQQYFDWDTKVDRMIEIYNQVLTQQGVDTAAASETEMLAQSQIIV